MTQTVKQSSIVSYLDHFIANAKFRSISGGRIGLSVRAVANYTNFRIVFKDFETFLSGTIYFTELNKTNVDAFKHWLLIERNYSDNHAGRLMGTLKTICVDAKKNDIEVHPYINYVSGFAQSRQDKLINILTFSDLERIEQVQLPSERLENTRKWMIIGFWLGQRVSDLLALSKLDIRSATNGGVYVDILQKKTRTAVTVGVINPLAVQIISHHFPRRIGDRCFNRYLKEVLAIAGINEEVKGYRHNSETKRKEIGLFCCFVINPFESDPGLESDLAAQAANIEAIENAIAALAASYATGAATADETAAEVTALTAALAAAQADIATILQNNNVLSADLVINDAATLAYATALGDKVSIINGNVTITQGSLDTAAVSAVTSKIATVVGTVSVTAAAALDFSTLTAVSGNYEVAGFDVEDDALTSAANVTLNYAGGYTQPNLTTAGAIDLNTTSYTSTATGTLEIDFSGLTSATSITNNGVGANDLTAAVATNVNLGAVAIASLTAPKALTVTLGKTDATAVTISTASATAVIVGGTTALSGNLAITASGNVTLSALKTVGGTTTITTAGELSAPALTTLTGVSAITASAVNTDALKTLTGAATVSKASVLNLPALTTVSGGLTAANLITLNTPVLAATSTITTASATTYIMKSVDAIGRFASLANLESITLSAQTASLDFGGAAKLATLNVVGTANTTDITIGNALKLAAVSLSGKLGVTTIEGALTSLTTGLTTAGTIESLTISGTSNLTGANLGHTEDAANGAQLTVVNNAKLASLSTNINRVTKFVVTGNAKLASIDASSMVSMPVNSTSSTAYTFDISGNSNAATTFATETGLKGAFTAAAPATATTAATDAIYKQNSLLTVKPYLTTVMTAALATSATATGTVNLDYVILSGTTATATKSITTGHFSAANKAEVAKVAAE